MFKVGDVVALYISTTIEKRKIEKIYANGRFILKGDPDRRQYSPNRSGTQARHRTNGTVYPWAPHHQQKFAEQQVQVRWESLRYKISKLSSQAVTAEFVDAIEAAYNRALKAGD